MRIKEGLLLADDFHGVDAGVIDFESPMQVRTGDAAGGADFADDVAGFYFVADFGVNFGEVTVERVDAEAVIDYDGISCEVELFRKNDAAALCCMDRSSRGRRQIDARVWAV